MSEKPEKPSATIEKKQHAVIARAMNKLEDEDHLKSLMRMIDEAVVSETGVSLVIVDLSRVTIIPSLALGMLVQISNKCKARQQKLKLAGVNPQLRQVFSITRLDRVFEFTPDVEGAME